MRIIFMGTPDFAVASLSALLEAGENIVAVVTAPDRPAGRGQKLKESAVKEFAVAHQIPVLQPEKLKDPSFLEELKALKADLQVVVAFRMLPEVVWNMPPLGTVNLHASLLPQYRGAAPINHAIIQGEKQTGVTTFLLQHEIDTGHILMAEAVSIGPDETAGELYIRLMHTGADLLTKTVRALAEGRVEPKPQLVKDEKLLQPAPKIFREDCRIEWDQSSERVYNFIRGLSPYPAAFTTLDGKTLKIFRAAKQAAPEGTVLPEPGTLDTDAKTYLQFSTQDGYIQALEVQLEGKRKMEVTDFLRGYQIGIVSGRMK